MIYPNIIKVCIVSILILCLALSNADEMRDENDCPIVTPDFSNMILLTREERIQLMDQALKDALSQVQDCKQKITDMQKQNNAASGAGNANSSDSGGESNNTNNSEGNAEAQQQTQDPQSATPSSDISGSEASEQPASNNGANNPPPASIPSSELSGSEPPATESKSSDQQPATSQTTKDDKKTLENGKLPEDIPPADNDDIIARQIRAAAQAESDPEKQAKLWNEYRRYKGIPQE